MLTAEDRRIVHALVYGESMTPREATLFAIRPHWYRAPVAAGARFRSEAAAVAYADRVERSTR
jgi:hypothetical protein